MEGWRMRPEQVARRVLKQYWDWQVPVDVEALANRCGVQVQYVPALGVSGIVKRMDEGALIRVDATEPEVRRRFTIAHELGHFLLGHLSDQPEYRDPSRNYTLGNFDPKERDANRFAAELLMPAEAVRAVVLKMENAGVEEIAKAFGVSKVAMGIRLKSMGILPQWVEV